MCVHVCASLGDWQQRSLVTPVRSTGEPCRTLGHHGQLPLRGRPRGARRGTAGQRGGREAGHETVSPCRPHPPSACFFLHACRCAAVRCDPMRVCACVLLCVAYAVLRGSLDCDGWAEPEADVADFDGSGSAARQRHPELPPTVQPRASSSRVARATPLVRLSVHLHCVLARDDAVPRRRRRVERQRQMQTTHRLGRTQREERGRGLSVRAPDIGRRRRERGTEGHRRRGVQHRERDEADEQSRRGAGQRSTSAVRGVAADPRTVWRAVADHSNPSPINR